MFDRSHSPPPSTTGTMWSASHRCLPAAPVLFELPPRGVVELALVFTQRLGVDAANRADAAIAREDLLAADSRGRCAASIRGRRPRCKTCTAPSAELRRRTSGTASRCRFDPSAGLGRGACSHAEFVAQAAHAVDDPPADLADLLRRQRPLAAIPPSRGTTRSCVPPRAAVRSTAARIASIPAAAPRTTPRSTPACPRARAAPAITERSNALEG